MNEARPFEEYKEMIKDMSKDNMIKGLYDLSKDIIEKDNEIQKYKKFVDDILNFYKHNRYEEELTEDNMFKLVLNQNEMILTIEEFKGDEQK